MRRKPQGTNRLASQVGTALFVLAAAVTVTRPAGAEDLHVVASCAIDAALGSTYDCVAEFNVPVSTELTVDVATSTDATGDVSACVAAIGGDQGCLVWLYRRMLGGVTTEEVGSPSGLLAPGNYGLWTRVAGTSVGTPSVGGTICLHPLVPYYCLPVSGVPGMIVASTTWGTFTASALATGDGGVVDTQRGRRTGGLS